MHKREIATVFLKITAKRQVTLPVRVLEALGVTPGDWIELEERPGGFVLRPRHIDRTRLAPPRAQLPPREAHHEDAGVPHKSP